MTSKVLEKLKILVDKKVETLSKKPNFRKDPIGGKYAWSTSVISSAYKRHGAISVSYTHLTLPTNREV